MTINLKIMGVIISKHQVLIEFEYIVAVLIFLINAVVFYQVNMVFKKLVLKINLLLFLSPSLIN